MADLIDRQAAMDILYECGGDEMYPPNMIKMRGKMLKLPAVDAVKVVRCKDCEREQTCRIAQRLGIFGYCSEGERREENAAD